MDTEWIALSEVQVGDRVRVSGFSSWTSYATREDAESSEQPFRLVASVEPGWRGTSRTRLVFEDGFACQLTLDAIVPCQAPASESQ